MKIIIAGGRDFNDYDLLFNKMLTFTARCDFEELEIVSGGAKGADFLGEGFAKEAGCKLTVFPAEWHKYGNQAGPIRNKQMAEYADALVVFWDGESRGTKNMIEQAKENGLKVRVVRY